ncbi:MAG: antitoxin VapB family protein [Nanoarchaeota archaeon]
MTVKTITITEGAYNSLKSLKGENESFSEVIGRITKKRSLLDFYGCLTKEEADSLEKSVEEGRKTDLRLQKEHDKHLWGK